MMKLILAILCVVSAKSFAITGDEVMMAVMNETLASVAAGKIDSFYSMQATGLYLEGGGVDADGNNTIFIATDGTRSLTVTVDKSGGLVDMKETTGGNSHGAPPAPTNGGLSFMKSLLEQSKALVSSDAELVYVLETLGDFSFKSDFTKPRTSDYFASLHPRGNTNAVLILFADKDGKVVAHHKGHMQ